MTTISVRDQVLAGAEAAFQTLAIVSDDEAHQAEAIAAAAALQTALDELHQWVVAAAAADASGWLATPLVQHARLTAALAAQVAARAWL